MEHVRNALNYLIKSVVGGDPIAPEGRADARVGRTGRLDTERDKPVPYDSLFPCNKCVVCCLAVGAASPAGEFAQRILGATAKRSRLAWNSSFRRSLPNIPVASAVGWDIGSPVNG